MNSIVVSVVVSVYNQENYIKQCLDSILKQQTSFNFEIVLGEDESNDGTRAICKDYGEKYPNKIKLFLRSRKDVIFINGSATGRFNFSQNLMACQGKYIALCEGDDYWTDPLKLQKQVDFLEAHPDINLCFHRANMLRNDVLQLHPIPKDLESNTFNYIELLKHYNFITTASVVFRKPESFKLPNWFTKITFGDLGLYKLVSQEKQIYCLNETMSVYRIHDKGIYSGISELKAQHNYLTFYKIIYPSLNVNEKIVTKGKMELVQRKIAKLKFSKSSVLQKIYYMYLRLNV